jgi:hypothetical protein
MKHSIQPGDIISHSQMSLTEGYSLQRGMNFRVNNGISVILMSVRKGAPYADSIDKKGQILIYEGHDVPRNMTLLPKTVDQPQFTPSGKLTQNGKFYEAALNYKQKETAELVKVYEKIKDGIWVYNGVFELIDAWLEKSDKRKVFKFKLKITDKTINQKRKVKPLDLEHNRLIPSNIKLEVWKRDKGQCVECGKTDNLHYDHDIPFSKGGSSITVNNIRLLCARHNLQKSDKIK